MLPAPPIVTAPDGYVWFTESSAPTGTPKIGRITPAGSISEFDVSAAATDIAVGPDGNLWIVEPFVDRIGRFEPATGTLTEFTTPTPASVLNAITAGPDGNLWFAERRANNIGRITRAARSRSSPSPR